MAAKKTPVLFARIGWMNRYRGPAPDDCLIGGGSYNEDQVGSEVYNFKPDRGRLRGFVQPPAMTPDRSILNLRRIDPSLDAQDRVRGVTVIFVARNPDQGGQKIIGWYRNATVFRAPRDGPTADVPDRCFNLEAQFEDSVLLPARDRNHEIPGGKGGMGQANVRYAFESNGDESRARWVHGALDYVSHYNGENLLTNPEIESLDNTEAVLEAAAGFQADAKLRRLIEEHVINLVSALYKKLGYRRIENVGDRESYDLRCERTGTVRKVEVKGLQSSRATILLTRNEVELARTTPVDLCIVHSIRLVDSKPRGGVIRRIERWKPDDHKLRAVSFVCEL